MAGLRLGIDLDGVVADFNAAWTHRYNRDYGAALRPEDVTTWRAPASLTHFGSMSQFWRWARTCSDGASLFRDMEPYPGALDALRRLAHRHRVVVLTTKPSYAVHDTLAWLADHRFPTTEVHITDDKAAIACDVYLDDADHNLQRIRGARPESVVCRFVRAWNSPIDGVVDITGWDEFEAVVDRVDAALA